MIIIREKTGTFFAVTKHLQSNERGDTNLFFLYNVKFNFLKTVMIFF